MIKTCVIRLPSHLPPPIFAVFLAMILASCSVEKTILGERISPDSRNSVQIVSVENAGPGQNSQSLVVRFKNKDASDYREIAVFNGNGVVEPIVSADWKDNKTVLIAYEEANVGFQAVRIGDVSIEYEEK